jgi:uncharacterized protein (TIGR02217 family)
MSHLDAYLGPCPTYGWSITPRFKTRIVDLANGDEFRNAEWVDCRHEANAPFLNISRDAYRELKRMFLVCRGMLHAFRLRDELDFTGTDEIFGIGNGTLREFQLSKISTVDGLEYVRNVYALPSVPVITINGTATTAFEFNTRTGRIKFTTAPAAAAVLRWTGTFDLWVRFSTDDMPFSLDDPNATNGQVGLIEVPPPVEPFV